jgi:predicted RNA binding protein with dsRBD fold (UPF0201 family)
MTDISIQVKSKIYPTENPDKVKDSIRNIIGDIELHNVKLSDQLGVKGNSEGLKSLTVLRHILRKMRIRDAARTVFLKNSNEYTLTFNLNKQAAYAGKFSFHNSEVSSLGSIHVLIQGDIPSVVKFLCG